MTLKLKSLKADSAKEIGGYRIEVPDWDGVFFTVRPLSYLPYRMAVEEGAKRLLRKYKREITPERKADERRESGRAIARHILLGWEGFDEDYSPELAEDLLQDLDWRALYDAVLFAAARAGEIEAEYVEEAEKNSAPPSATI